MTTVAVNAEHALVEQIDTPTAMFFTSCVHCGMCADACLFYTETQDPKYTPVYKLLPMRRVWKQKYTFWGSVLKTLGLSRPISNEELASWEPLLYDSCTLCGRCSMVCPMGNDLVYMIRKMREAMVASGHAPKGLKAAMIRSIETGSPMGVNLQTLKAQIKHAEAETGLKIPLDVENSEYMLLLSSNEIVLFDEIVPAIAKLFSAANVSWTLCSSSFEATNPGVQIGSSDLAKELIERIVAGAQKLNVKTVISPECGHAYMALRWEGPNLIGRKYPFKVKHILEVLDELTKQGRIRTKGAEKTALTFHDPCQAVRRGGVIDQPRHLLEQVASNFVEMKEHGEMNWCCGGGGGVSVNERAQALKQLVFNRKKKQIEELGVNTVVTACATCRATLEEGVEHNNMNVKIASLTETLAKYLEKSERGVAIGE